MKPAKFLILLGVLIAFYGCYGRPDSPLVNLVGKDLPDFVDMTEQQVAEVTLSGKYQVVYLRKDYDRYREQGDPGDTSFVILKDLETGKEEILMEGHLGHDVDYAYFSPGGRSILFTLNDVRSADEITHICRYDLDTRNITSKCILLDRAAYENPELFLGGTAFISELYLADDGAEIFFSVYYEKGAERIESYDYFVYDVKRDTRRQVSPEVFKRMKDSIQSDNVHGYAYVRNGKKFRLFPIVPYSDYLPGNYKHAYNGIYITDGQQNMRISRVDGHEIIMDTVPIWIEDGTKIMCAGYVFDATGFHKEKKLVDGVILAVREK